MLLPRSEPVSHIAYWRSAIENRIKSEITVPFLPYSDLFGFVLLPAGLMAMIIGLAFVYAITTELVKKEFYARLTAA
jgi:hypothetical protein